MKAGSERRPSRARELAALCLASAVPLLALLFAERGTAAFESWLRRPPPVEAVFPIRVEVPRGEGARSVARRLVEAGLLSDARPWLAWLRLSGSLSRLQAGEYEIAAPASPEALGRLLVEGHVVLHSITLAEGLALEESVAALAASGLWSREELLVEFRSPARIRELDPDASDLEGYLFPETYRFPRGTEPSRVAEVLVDGFRRVWRELDGEARARELGLSTRELVTLASLVEEETSLPQERRLVASVFHNRLRRGMKLQCDPTVIVALQRDGLWTGGPLLRAQLRHDSPYNTYRHAGLPPGPLSSPGAAALAAALAPAESRLLYFVADGSGGHAFAETLRQHDRNVRRWRRLRDASR